MSSQQFLTSIGVNKDDGEVSSTSSEEEYGFLKVHKKFPSPGSKNSFDNMDTHSLSNSVTNSSGIYLTNSKPRPVYQWSVQEVTNWFKRHCGEHSDYSDIFMENDIVGKVLLRITSNTLERMGILNNEHREHIWREIVKLKLKTDIMEIKDLERPSLENDI